MLRVFIPLALLFSGVSHALADRGDPGSFIASYRQVTVTRPTGSTFTARLFYPATSNVENAPIDPSGGPYPAISFGHGFVQAVTNYQSTLLHLATHGYLVIATNSEGGLFPNHSNFAADLLHSLTYLEEQNSLPGSFLEDLVDTSAFALSGHSMGGGASILAASDPRIRAIAPLAAANTNPSSIAASGSFFIPVRHIVGSSDTIVSPSTTIQMFNNSARAKQFVSLQGGFHCGFIDAQGFGCDTGSMSRADQLRLTRRLLTEFFDLYLKGDQTAWPEVWLPEAQADPRAIFTYAPDSEIAPAATTLTVRAGSTAIVPISILNLAPDVMSLSLEHVPAPWPITFDPSDVGPIAVNDSATSTVAFAIPPTAALNQTEVIIAARSGRDGQSRSLARFNVNVICAADFNNDGKVDFFDVQAFLQAFTDELPEADLNSDGHYNFFDVQIFLTAFAAGCN